MNKIKKVLHELNYLKIEDLLQIILFFISIPLSVIYKVYIFFAKKDIWLICEDRNEARDNGFCFFKYLNEKQPQITSYYAIDYKSKDYEKVKKIGKTIRYGSLKHWILYFNSKYNISSQKSGKPDAAICYILEVYRIIKSKSIFLQHGITINKAKWLFYDNTRMRLFICGAKPEYEYIKKYFGYPEENVKYLGFNRFDDYHNIEVNKKQILLMPSWREWIASKNEYSKKYEDTTDFTKTEYFQKYQQLINNKNLIDFLEQKDLVLYFYPHRNMQKYIEFFNTNNDRIKIVTSSEAEIRNLLIKSAVMITDFSSVAMDFAYMKKPVIYYQFDEKRFREAQYEEGYFDYRQSGLGKVFNKEEEVIEELKRLYENDLKMSENFERAHKNFFTLYDDKNNERIFNEISKI